MRTVLIIMCIIFSTMLVHSQSISKQVIGSSGALIENSSHTLNFTLGEPIVGLVQNEASIHQGFWGSLFEDETLSVSTPIEVVEGISLFPNPVVNYLNIQFKTDQVNNFTVQLFDITGKQILNQTISSQNQTQQIDLSQLSNGAYLVVIYSKTINYQKSFKIIKK